MEFTSACYPHKYAIFIFPYKMKKSWNLFIYFFTKPNQTKPSLCTSLCSSVGIINLLTLRPSWLLGRLLFHWFITFVSRLAWLLCTLVRRQRNDLPAPEATALAVLQEKKKVSFKNLSRFGHVAVSGQITTRKRTKRTETQGQIKQSFPISAHALRHYSEGVRGC